MDLEDEFVQRCKEIEVPRSVLNAAWHQVGKHQLTMIVVKKNGEIHMWFKELPYTIKGIEMRYRYIITGK